MVQMRLLLGRLCYSGLFLANIANGAVIRVSADQSQFVVKLASNPTTGYQWSVIDYNKHCMSLKESHYLAPKRQLIGAGGQMIFTFNNLHGPKACASTTISFNYARPWESKSGSVKNIIVQFASKDK